MKWTIEQELFIYEGMKGGSLTDDLSKAFHKRFGGALTKSALSKKIYRLRNGEGKMFKRQLHSGEAQALANQIGSYVIADPKRQPNLNEILDAMEQLAAISLDVDRQREEISIVLPKGGKWQALVCMGDWHLGNHTTMLPAIREELNRIANTPDMWYIFNGDATDNFIGGGKITSGQHEQTVAPKVARQVVVALFDIVREKMLAAVTGCHDKWSINVDDYDFIEQLTTRVGCAYLGSGGTVNVRAGDVIYRMAVMHKYRRNSGIHLDAACRMYLRDVDMTADVVAIAHNHESLACYEEVQGAPKVYLRTGTYKPNDRFAQGIGYKTSPCWCPVVLLNTERHEMRIAVSLEEASDLLTFLNSRE